MADLAALRTALTHMGFSDVAAAFIIDSQGMDDLTEFALLKDNKVESLCKVIRHSGGMILNPQAAVTGQPPTLPNPGIAVPLCMENNLKLMCFYLHFKQCTSQALVAASITLDTVRSYHDYKEWEQKHENT